MSAACDVAVNLLWLAPGRVGGSEEYLARQLAGLPSAAPLTLTLYVQPGFPGAHPALVDRYRTVVAPLARDWRPLRMAAEHSWLALRTRHAGIVHHGGGTAPVVGPRHTVVTVHDLQYLVFPGYFSKVRLAYLRRMTPRSIGRATVVTTPSEYVRARVIEVFGRDPASVVVVPHGVPGLTTPDHAAIAAALARYAVRRPYVVYPAITHPHKGHRVLVEMLRATAGAGHPLQDLQLVLIGGEGPAESTVREAIAAAGVADRVVRPGRVPAADRDGLLAGAEALVFPSEYEGFGAPLVEAMALGTPVVCSAHPAIVEVVGDAGVVVAARDGDAWAAAVSAARARRPELVGLGHARRQAYTAATSGQCLLDAYVLAAEMAGAR